MIFLIGGEALPLYLLISRQVTEPRTWPDPKLNLDLDNHETIHEKMQALLFFVYQSFPSGQNSALGMVFSEFLPPTKEASLSLS